VRQIFRERVVDIEELVGKIGVQVLGEQSLVLWRVAERHLVDDAAYSS
jgi:hypothetical protein